MALPYGQFLFRSVRELGAGGLGRVDEVEVIESNSDMQIGEHLARKRLGTRWAADAAALVRFEREIELMKVMDHPNIVRFRGENLPNGERCYLMPLYPRSLRDLLRVAARHEWQTVAMFGATIADAMAYAHTHNFVHRDLKPENILLTAAGEPIIADWGLGQFIHKTSTVLVVTKGGVGTEYYCSAQQWAGQNPDHRTDIYSLGVMLAELVTGAQRPIQPVGMGIQVDVVAALSTGAMLFNAAIKRMTALVPSTRHGSMTEVASDLRQAALLAAA